MQNNKFLFSFYSGNYQKCRSLTDISRSSNKKLIRFMIESAIFLLIGKILINRQISNGISPKNP